MNTNLMKVMKTVLCGLVVSFLGVLPARAATFYLSESASGVAADFGQSATYDLETGLPGADDQIYVGDNRVLKVTDENVASLSARGTTIYCATKAKVAIDLASAAELKAQFTYNGSVDCAGIVKTGAGTLTLTQIDTPKTESSRFVGLKQRWHILGGTVVFPQTKITQSSVIDLLEIGEGCTVVNINGYVAYDGITGWGNLEHRAEDSTRITVQGLTEFHGNILQATGAGSVQIYVSTGAMLYGTAGTAYSGPMFMGGLVGLGKFGEQGSPSTLGTSGKFNFSDNVHLLALGAAEEVSNKQFVFDSAVSTVEVDGGAYGGVTFTGAWDPTGAIMRSLVLSGSNTEHACVLKNSLADVAADAEVYPYHIVKKGTGVWRMSAANPKWSGAMTVEEGTLKFDSIAPAGTACSLGYATNLYANVTGAKLPENKVDWAVKLGNSGEGEVATLEYAGSAAAEWPTNRPIVVNGCGRFRNVTGQSFTLAGVTAMAAGSLLALDGDAASANELAGISEGAGSLKLVKEGAGDWTLSGDVDISGGLNVKTGVLKVRNRKYYNWFKVIVKQTFAWTPGTTSAGTVTIQEFALYDVNGVRQNLNPTIGDPQVGAAAGTLAPGGLAYGPCVSGSETTPLVNMTHASKDDQWAYKADRMPDPDIPSTWVSFVIRVPEGTPEIEKFDLRYWKATSTATANSLYSPKIMEIQGSTDGLSWSSITSVTNPPVASGEVVTSYYCWLYGDHARYDATRDPANSGRTFDRRAIVPEEIRPEVSIGGGMAVASSATVRVEGEPLEIDRLEFDFVAGIGSFSNLVLASSGTIVMKNVPKGAVTIPADLAGVSNLSAAENWAVVDADGHPFKRKVVVRSDSVSVLANGMILIFR